MSDHTPDPSVESTDTLLAALAEPHTSAADRRLYVVALLRVVQSRFAHADELLGKVIASVRMGG